MADIEVVIKIPEGLKKDFELEQWTALSCMEMKDALMNGTPLPKGHGRLIDGDALYDQYRYADYDFDKTMEYVSTIIEADKESEE